MDNMWIHAYMINTWISNRYSLVTREINILYISIKNIISIIDIIITIIIDINRHYISIINRLIEIIKIKTN